jgi:hypothetical protein
MSGTSRSTVHSSASGRIKTENHALVKLLTSDSLTDTTRFVAAEHKSQDLKQHASTNSNDRIKSTANSRLNSPEKNSVENRPNSRYSEKSSSEKVNTDKRLNSRHSEKKPPVKINTEERPSSRYSVKNSPEQVNTEIRPNSRYSEKNSSEIINTDKRPNSTHSEKKSPVKTNTEERPSSRYSVKNSPEQVTTEIRPDSKHSVKSDKTGKQKNNSNHSSWGNVDESLTFDVEDINKIENPDFDKISQTSNSPINKNIENIIYTDNSIEDNRFTNVNLDNTDKLPSSNSIKLGSTLGNNSPSKIDYLKVERVDSPTFERACSREENKPPSRTSQSYSYNRLKNSSTSASQQHPLKVARSASQLIDAQGGDGFEGDSLDVDSGVVPDTTSFLESAPDTGRQTYRVPTPVYKDVPVIKSADSSRIRANSRTSQRSLSANSATGVPLPQLDRTESLVSDNGIPPPSNINYNLPSQDIGEVDQDSPTRKVDQRKSAVSFKEPVITNYHSRADTENWDTPRDRVPTPHPTSPRKYQDSLDFENNGRTSNLSPEPTHQLESEIPSAIYSQTSGSANVINSAKSGSGRPVKKVYIDSPTFTKEEEDEFRFVESRLDEMNDDLEDSVRRIEEQGNRYRQEREAMNEEAARLRAEIQATEGYSNSYNSRTTSDRYGQRDNYSDNYSKPITHPSDEMDSRSYGRRDQDSDYRQGYSDSSRNNGNQRDSRNYGNLRDSRDVYNERSDNRYEDRNIDDRNINDRNDDDQEGYSRNRGGYSQNEYSRRQNDQHPQRQDDQNRRRQDEQYSRRQDDQSSRRPDDPYSQRQDDQYSRHQDDQYSRRQDDQYSRRQDDQYSRRQDDQYSRRQDDQYSRRQDDQYYDRRGDSPSRFQNGDERGDDDLQRETEYQEDLRHRLDSNQKHDSEVVIPRIPLGDDQFRDSLDENGYNDQHNFVRDSLEHEGYGNWGNPPPNPFGQGRGDNAGYLNQREERPDFVDDNDTARMELLHPQEPRVDYVEENKFTYGLPQNKSYKTLKVKEKEAEQKLTEIFIHPKKPVKKHKRTIPLANEERRPPLTELRGDNADGAEGVWAKRSAQLAKQKDSKQKTGSGSIKKARGLQKYPSDSGLQQSSNQGQIRQGQGRMYGTPTRNQYLEPLGFKPQMSQNEPRESPAYREGSYKRPMELEPIKTEITTDDGQKISVDINLKVLSPTFPRRIKSHPNDAPESEPPFNVHAEVKQKHQGDRRGGGGPYQPAYRPGGDQPKSDNQQQPSDSRSQNNKQLPHNSQQNGRQPQDNQYNNRQYQVSMLQL